MSVQQSQAAEPETPSVWVTVVTDNTSDGKKATAAWDSGKEFQWAVPPFASKGDFVLGWITGGTGFRYVLEVIQPLGGTKSDYGTQAILKFVDLIDPSIDMRNLRFDRSLRNWRLTRQNMQGALREQTRPVSRDPEWPALLGLLEGRCTRGAWLLGGTLHRDPGTQTTVPKLVLQATLEQDNGPSSQWTVTHALGDVMARATAINDKRESFDLSFSSLMLGLTESPSAVGRWLSEYLATQDVDLGPILSNVQKDPAATRAAAERGARDSERVLGGPLRSTASALRAMSEARSIADGAADGSGVGVIDIPHLIAAFASLPDYHERDFSALKLDRRAWCRALVEYLFTVSDDAGVQFWKRFYERRFPEDTVPLAPDARVAHRPDYDADAYTEQDLLSIEDEVDALAYVLASVDTKPPLAIGLFGEWGSGKTFFMKHLARKVERLCRGAREQSARDRNLHGSIAQIEFNAWHYQEGDLWAGLVDHILRNLRFGDDEDESKLAEWRSKMVLELSASEKARDSADKEVDALEQQRKEAASRVETLQEQARAKHDQLTKALAPGRAIAIARATVEVDPELRAKADEVARELGLPAVQRTAAELREALAQARAQLTGVQSLFVPLLGPKGLRYGLFLAAAILVPLLIGLVIDTIDEGMFSRVSSLAASAATGIGGITAWLWTQVKVVRDLRARVEPVARQMDAAVESQVEAALSEQKKEIAAALGELDTIRTSQAEAIQKRDAAAQMAAETRERLGARDTESIMRNFLDARIGEGFYQDKLGTAALVRRDFDRLSKTIEKLTERELRGQIANDEIVINRIILYIDDLDRCDMDKVVPVLRAVHLLLAFPAFVVVVGVDSRWVARCLERHHRDIFQDDERGLSSNVTPLDYLEKIFQIPIWLEPVDPETRVRMAQTLLNRRSVVSKEAVDRAKTETPAAPGTESVGTGEGTDESTTDGTNGGGKGTNGLERLPTQSPPAGDDLDKPELNPRGLSISEEEQTFLTELGPLLSSSPRAIKRFVNTYRLMNVVLARSGMPETSDRPRDSHVRMFLMTVLVGMPELSRWLQEAIDAFDGKLDGIAVPKLLNSQSARDILSSWSARTAGAAREQWSTVGSWMGERAERGWTDLPVSRLKQWMGPVGRYTFNLLRDRNAPNAKGEASGGREGEAIRA